MRKILPIFILMFSLVFVGCGTEKTTTETEEAGREKYSVNDTRTVEHGKISLVLVRKWGDKP